MKNTPFSNYQHFLENITPLSELEFQALLPKYRTARLVWTILIYILIILIITFVFKIPVTDISPEILYILLGNITILLILRLIIIYFGHNKKKYALRQKDIIYREGLIWHSQTTVPFNKIQHSEVVQNPVEKYYQLAKLKLYTAGGSRSDLVIPGISLQTAETLKTFILSTANISDEEE